MSYFCVVKTTTFFSFIGHGPARGPDSVDMAAEFLH